MGKLLLSLSLLDGYITILGPFSGSYQPIYKKQGEKCSALQFSLSNLTDKHVDFYFSTVKHVLYFFALRLCYFSFLYIKEIVGK